MNYESQSPISLGNHTSRKKKNFSWLWILLGIIIIALIVVFILRRNTQDESTETTTNTESAGSEEPIEATPTPVTKAVFDVPSIINKNIDDIRKDLKTYLVDAKEEQEPDEAGSDEWDNSFEKDGQELLVTFNPKNRKVIDFFIFADESMMDVNDKNKQTLLLIGNLKTNASNYTVDFSTETDGTEELTGIQITPK